MREQALGKGKLSLSKHNSWDEMLLKTSLSPLNTSSVSRLHVMKQSSGPFFSTDFSIPSGQNHNDCYRNSRSSSKACGAGTQHVMERRCVWKPHCHWSLEHRHSHFSPALLQVFSPPVISVPHLPCLLLFLSQLLAALPSLMASFQIHSPLLKSYSLVISWESK